MSEFVLCLCCPLQEADPPSRKTTWLRNLQSRRPWGALACNAIEGGGGGGEEEEEEEEEEEDHNLIIIGKQLKSSLLCLLSLILVDFYCSKAVGNFAKPPCL
jgi:hypothetical protein